MTEFCSPSDAYDIYGSAPLRYVLVHGVGGRRKQWIPLTPDLATGAGALAIDLAGHGSAKHIAIGSVATPPTAPSR
jgi:alpha-beta hydrolase superfamily lysophospholipase